MPPKITDSSTPTLGQLSAKLREFRNWYLLGVVLDVSKDTLDSIKKSHDTNVERCIEMLQCWITNSNNPTWETIHEALRNIGESVIAAEIACKYDIRPSSARDEKSPALSSEHLRSKGEERSLVHKTSSALRSRLFSQEQRRICCHFAIAMDRITEIVEEVVKPEKLLRFLCFYCHPLYPEMLYVDQKILKCTSNVSEVMKSLVPDYINYMETGLLEAIIERFNCQQAQHLLQQYHDCYPHLRHLRDMPDPVPDERLDLTRRKRLRAKCDGDFDSARATDVKRVQTSIESATGIDHQFVTPAQHSEGCFILTFLIPESVSGLFHELCDEDLEILAKAGIMELQIDDFVINDIEKFHLQRTRISTQSIRVISANQTGVTTKGFDSHIEQRVEQFTGKEKDQLKCLLESIPRSRLEEVCTDSFLQQLATHVRDWRKLAPHFGISESTAEELAHHFRDMDEQRYRALHWWKQINPDTATYQSLIACLLAHAPFDLAEAALKMLIPGMHINGITVKL